MLTPNSTRVLFKGRSTNGETRWEQERRSYNSVKALLVRRPRLGRQPAYLARMGQRQTREELEKSGRCPASETGLRVWEVAGFGLFESSCSAAGVTELFTLRFLSLNPLQYLTGANKVTAWGGGGWGWEGKTWGTQLLEHGQQHTSKAHLFHVLPRRPQPATHAILCPYIHTYIHTYTHVHAQRFLANWPWFGPFLQQFC
jgi:hypothetical protein